MTSLNVDKICERVARPYLKHHGTTIAGLIVNGESHFRAFSGKQCSDTASKMRNAIFEIGSITKTFTAILVCELARQGKIKLDDPISKYLHGFDTLPDWITPRSLSSHTSGLPRIPDGLDIADMANPYKGISREKLADWVKTIANFPPRSPKMSYSNLGVGILGLAASEIAGSDFQTALEDIVLAPLGLADTDTIVSPENVDRLAPPLGLFGRKVQVWDFDALAGCGALKSTANDMASYANAFISAKNGSNTPLSEAIRMSAEVQFAAKKDFEPDMCLGWLRLRDKKTGLPIWHHDGGTGGSSSTLFVCPDRHFAVFALANTQTTMWTSLRQVFADPMGMLSDLIEAQQS